MTNILWVEDQFHWIDKLEKTLKEADFEDGSTANTLHIFKFAEAACQHIRTQASPPHIAILDANLNGNDQGGFKVSQVLLKKWPELPIIYLSEHSGTRIEQQALNKPETRDFIAKHQHNIEEILCWRIKAAIRQVAIVKNKLNPRTGDVLCSGALSMDLATWQVYWHGRPLMNPKNNKRPLAPIPRKILKHLVECSPRPLSTAQAAERLGLENFNYPSYRQHIRTLRHAFEQVATALNHSSFIDDCSKGYGIVTFGDEGAYYWQPNEVKAHEH